MRVRLRLVLELVLVQARVLREGERGGDMRGRGCGRGVVGGGGGRGEVLVVLVLVLVLDVLRVHDGNVCRVSGLWVVQGGGGTMLVVQV